MEVVLKVDLNKEREGEKSRILLFGCKCAEEVDAVFSIVY